MVKRKKKVDKGHEETQKEDLDAFEEWEAGEEPAPEAPPEPEEEAPAEVPAEVPLAEEDLDFADLEAPPEEAKKAAPAVAEAVSEEEFSESLMNLAPDVPVNLVAVIGKTTSNVGDLMKTKAGGVIDLGRPPGETVDLVANGRLIARGELVEMDGQLGVRILKMVK